LKTILTISSKFVTNNLSKFSRRKKDNTEMFYLTELLIKDEINDSPDKDTIRKEYEEILNIMKAFTRELEENFMKIPHYVFYIFIKLKK